MNKPECIEQYEKILNQKFSTTVKIHQNIKDDWSTTILEIKKTRWLVEVQINDCKITGVYYYYNVAGTYWRFYRDLFIDFDRAVEHIEYIAAKVKKIMKILIAASTFASELHLVDNELNCIYIDIKKNIMFLEVRNKRTDVELRFGIDIDKLRIIGFHKGKSLDRTFDAIIEDCSKTDNTSDPQRNRFQKLLDAFKKKKIKELDDLDWEVEDESKD